MSHERIRTFNKHFTNRLTLKFAGETRTPFAVVHHVGRKSGKAYTTPIMVEPVKGGFIIELTYGPEVDWYRNVVAAGQCTLRWHSKTYELQEPEMVDTNVGLGAFHPLPRLLLRLLHRKDFVRMRRRLVKPSAKQQ